MNDIWKVVFKLILVIDGWDIFCEIVLNESLNLTDEMMIS